MSAVALADLLSNGVTTSEVPPPVQSAVERYVEIRTQEISAALAAAGIANEASVDVHRSVQLKNALRVTLADFEPLWIFRLELPFGGGELLIVSEQVPVDPSNDGIWSMDFSWLEKIGVDRWPRDTPLVEVEHLDCLGQPTLSVRTIHHNGTYEAVLSYRVQLNNHVPTLRLVMEDSLPSQRISRHLACVSDGHVVLSTTRAGEDGGITLLGEVELALDVDPLSSGILRQTFVTAEHPPLICGECSSSSDETSFLRNGY